ncbi:hypothetical protein J14TS5_31140 [Paenibacillus lautus]|nr:hypothetical protein J14TS5_31140 [Paenibacillus lautus]
MKASINRLPMLPVPIKPTFMCMFPPFALYGRNVPSLRLMYAGKMPIHDGFSCDFGREAKEYSWVCTK